MRVGIRVVCRSCGREKKPYGRSAPAEAMMCTDDACNGYFTQPFPGELWPGESEKDFGQRVRLDGTEEVPDAN